MANDQDLCPLPSHPRTVRVEPHTGIAAWPLEPGDELIVKNESGVKIEVEAGTLSHGRVQRINELVKDRDELRAKVDHIYSRLSNLPITDSSDPYQKAILDLLDPRNESEVSGA